MIITEIDPLVCELFEANQDNDLQKVEQLLAQHPHLCCAYCPYDQRDRHTLLHLAAEQGKLKVVQLCLAVPDVKMDMLNSAQETPLYLALKNNHIVCAETLLVYIRGHGAHYGGKPILWEQEKKLLEQEGSNFLVSAINSSCYYFVHFLAHVCYTKFEIQNNNPLHRAVVNSDWVLLDILLRGGAKVDYADKSGYTAIELAYHQRNSKALWRLMEHNLSAAWDLCKKVHSGRLFLMLLGAICLAVWHHFIPPKPLWAPIPLLKSK